VKLTSSSGRCQQQRQRQRQRQQNALLAACLLRQHSTALQLRATAHAQRGGIFPRVMAWLYLRTASAATLLSRGNRIAFRCATRTKGIPPSSAHAERFQLLLHARVAAHARHGGCHLGSPATCHGAGPTVALRRIESLSPRLSPFALSTPPIQRRTCTVELGPETRRVRLLFTF